MKDVFSEKELVDLEYFIKDMGIKVGYDSQNFAVTNGCATYYLYLDGFEQRTCLFKPSYFGRNPKGNWIAVDFIIGKNGNCVLGTVRNIDPSVAKNSSNYSDFYKGYVGKYWKFDVPHDFFDYFVHESKNSARKSIKEASDDYITVKEFCFWGYSGNMVEIWTIDGVLCDAFEVRNVGKSEYKNYEIHGWDCVKNTMIIYIKK